ARVQQIIDVGEGDDVASCKGERALRRCADAGVFRVPMKLHPARMLRARAVEIGRDVAEEVAIVTDAELPIRVVLPLDTAHELTHVAQWDPIARRDDRHFWRARHPPREEALYCEFLVL